MIYINGIRVRQFDMSELDFRKFEAHQSTSHEPHVTLDTAPNNALPRVFSYLVMLIFDSVLLQVAG